MLSKFAVASTNGKQYCTVPVLTVFRFTGWMRYLRELEFLGKSARGTLDAKVGTDAMALNCDESSGDGVIATSDPAFRPRLKTSGLGSFEPKLRVRGGGVLGSKDSYGGLRVSLRLLSDKGAA